jgi:hypothetical protein
MSRFEIMSSLGRRWWRSSVRDAGTAARRRTGVVEIVGEDAAVGTLIGNVMFAVRSRTNTF